jgi:hypothetical protein
MASVQTKLTKSERALLRELTSESWETELGEELEKLFENFTQWADHGMSALDLSDRIHEFCHGCKGLPPQPMMFAKEEPLDDHHHYRL